MVWSRWYILAPLVFHFTPIRKCLEWPTVCHLNRFSFRVWSLKKGERSHWLNCEVAIRYRYTNSIVPHKYLALMNRWIQEKWTIYKRKWSQWLGIFAFFILAYSILAVVVLRSIQDNITLTFVDRWMGGDSDWWWTRSRESSLIVLKLYTHMAAVQLNYSEMGSRLMTSSPR